MRAHGAAKLSLAVALVAIIGVDVGARPWPTAPPVDRSGALDRSLGGEQVGAGWVAARTEDAPTVLWGTPGERAPSAAPVPAARWHLARQGSRYGVSEAALDSLVVHLVHPTRGGGALVWLRQEIDGAPVYPARVSVLVDADGALVAIGGRPLELPAVDPPRATLGGDEAVAIALSDLYDAPLDASLLNDTGERVDGWRGYGLVAGAELAPGLVFREEARAMRIWAPTPAGLVRAFRVEVQARAAGDDEDRAWAYVIDAARGSVLRRTDLVHDGSFRVWLSDDLRPRQGPQEDYLPHPTGVPSSSIPAFVPPTLATLEAFNTNPGGTSDPWLPDGATTLSGNNVDVYLDLASPSGFGAGDFRAAADSPGVFDATYDPTLAPDASDAQLQGSAQPLFVVANWLHDWYYDAGFVEAAGNAQITNFGRGGYGGDPVVIEGQDYYFGGAANMSVPGDGSPPRLQVGNWPGSPGRPGALDMSIVGHEWIHHMHLRLVYCFSQQCIAESEGWSDFLALHMLLDEGDDLDGSYAIAIYAAKYISLDSAYYGARRYPYSADFAKNPLTLKHIGQSVALPTTAPRNPFTGGTNNEVHRAGEVWAQMLWQAYMELLRDTLEPAPRLTYDEARRRMSEYAVTAMMLAPIDPSYTEQRDVLLAAAREVDLDDYAALARGFAERGAGTCAVGAARESGTMDDVVEGYEVAPILVWSLAGLDDADASCDGDGVLDPGEAGRARIAITNLGAVPLEGATLELSSETAELTLPEGGTIILDPLAPGADTVIEVPVALAAEAPAPLDAVVALALTADGLCGGAIERRDDVLTGYERAAASSFVETVELDAAGWTASGSKGVWSIRRLGPGDHAFHGADLGRPAVGRLVTPPMTVAAGASLTVSLRHAYRFEADTSGTSPTYYDGGIIEISTNNGASWQDVATVSDLTYPGSVVAGSSPLSQHAAFVGESPGYPALEALTFDLGDGFGGQTVRLAFTVGTDPFAGDEGWLIDDVDVSGLVSPPFDAAVASLPPGAYYDGDDDGFGVGDAVALCPLPTGYATEGGDCDDGDGLVFPGADEVCNGVDDDCDDSTDEELVGCVDPGPEPAVEPGPEPTAEPDPEPVADDAVVEDVPDVIDADTTAIPDTVNAGDVVETPDADVPDVEDTADLPDTTDASAPDVEDTADLPDTADPDVPDVEDTADVPDTANPDVPDVEDTADVPDTADAELPDVEDTLDVPDTADADMPDVDDTLDVPDTTDADMPDTADVPDVEDTTDVEEVSDTAEVEDTTDVIDVSDTVGGDDATDADIDDARDTVAAPDIAPDTLDAALTADTSAPGPDACVGSDCQPDASVKGGDAGGCSGGGAPPAWLLAAGLLLALVRRSRRGAAS